MAARPTLIHVPVSHYSEKIRGALDYKRFPQPPLHPADADERRQALELEA